MLSSGVGTISTIENFNTTTFILLSNLHSVRRPVSNSSISPDMASMNFRTHLILSATPWYIERFENQNKRIHERRVIAFSVGQFNQKHKIRGGVLWYIFQNKKLYFLETQNLDFGLIISPPYGLACFGWLCPRRMELLVLADYLPAVWTCLFWLIISPPYGLARFGWFAGSMPAGFFSKKIRNSW